LKVTGVEEQGQQEAQDWLTDSPKGDGEGREGKGEKLRGQIFREKGERT